MAVIIQQLTFQWEDLETASDLDRLRLVLAYTPDEELMRTLERQRGQGRDDYPIRAVWNSLLAGIVYQHVSIESLRRELLRNGELRRMCGFDPLVGGAAVPPAWAYTRFLQQLLNHQALIEALFDRLVTALGELVPDLGQRLAIDSKAVTSAGKPTTKSSADGRRDGDADWGTKKYQGVTTKGTAWEKVKSWFGYKLHVLIDATYELPVAYTVTRASAADTSQLLPLVEQHAARHPEIAARAATCAADRGYDSAVNNRQLYDDFGIAPIIAIRNQWKDQGDEGCGGAEDRNTRQVFPERCDNIMYDYQGRIFCYDCTTGNQRPLAFSGYEQDRRTLKYTCPIKAYGGTCPMAADCPHYGKSVRIPLTVDRRVFTPIARSSYKWQREYDRRTAVERVNSRLDVSFGWERHFVRGLNKMKVRVGLSLIVMAAMALGHLKEGRMECMRSLVGSVATTSGAGEG